ncbi:conserved exported protein of unknown function [Streptomyces ambofaciens ATCC 23877]|uniref:LamG-like jellyroll fold domain-containing protein n=1 Tax=Streptomyces ambofaciens (strain ATCC 23877 / 3486 / DSM 40053 / JCM 4204 / NBRC 12836 / NRRL B-2516) TaxID=278992 RepID=A3KK79_STRA7|nr:LamG domain-containing protein [Streptomyces ambofaciens]AKZ54272.1 conserved exported protein of unknown function [Streptomyces ambofaciens ATCC 23877]CAJ90115.1 conserved hypothetical protein [Streptomyces ambofaciens ATCC 23877]
MRARSRRRSVTAATVLAAALVATTPGLAAAADENLPPLRPSTATLTTDSAKACSDDPVYVPRAPDLRAVVEDPTEDNEPWETNAAGAEFALSWTDADGGEQHRTYTSPALKSPATQLWRTSDLPADTVVSWHVRAVDDEGAVSAWSDEGPGTTCRFIIDTVNPESPTVVSEQYPDDMAWHDGVGVYGSFTFDSPSEDVVEYDYSVLGSRHGRVRPEEPGGPVTVRWMPEHSGPYYMQVAAIDRTGRTSARTTHWLRVAEGRAPVAHWTLADPAGSGTAAAETGPAARAEDGVVFGAPAPSRTDLTATVALDGRGNSYLTPDVSVADTDGTFALSAWARPAATDTAMTVASQDAGDGTSAVTLGLSPAADGKAEWAFGYGGARVTGGSATEGGWAHLTGLYDAEDGTLSLHVNGTEVASQTGVAATAAPGAFQIGRARGDGGARWRGEIGDVRVWDRVVSGEEIERMGARPADLVAAWDIERTEDGSVPDRDGDTPLRLHGGTGFYTPDFDACLEDPECVEFPAGAIDGNDHLALDGADDYAATDGPPVDTADSYSVGLRVRSTDTSPDRPMTVLSQGDADRDAFRVRYDPAAAEWQLVVTHGDEPGAPETVVAAPGVPTSHDEELVVVYDDSEGHITLYVRGEAVATARFNASWAAPGPLNVGRGHTADGGWGEYFHGGVDTVRVFRGALTPTEVKSFAYAS